MAPRWRLVPPRSLLLLFITITLGLASALVWLGWQLVRQDRILEAQRLRERLEGTAGVLQAALERRLADQVEALDHLVGSPAASWPGAIDTLAPGTVILRLASGNLAEWPSGRLLYDPTLSPAWASADAAFEEGERLEYQSRGEPLAATAIYRKLASSSDPAVRAGAELRLGRVYRRAARVVDAEEAYRRLARHDTLLIGGSPAAVVARSATIELRLAQGDSAVRPTAESLLGDLAQGRWRISRSALEFHVADLSQRLESWKGASPTPGPDRAVLTAAADSLLPASAPFPPTGWRMIGVESTAVLALWARRGHYTVIQLASAGYVAASWLAPLDDLLDRADVWLALTGPGGLPVFSQLPTGGGSTLSRSPVETGLPWTLVLANRQPARLVQDLATRRRMLVAGLVVTVLLGLSGTYAVARAVSRELEVARLQSDFVSAVSHEFRTPLTSLRQLSELLASDRVPREERRHEYYEIMRRESVRLHRLVEGLLDFGRMEAGAHQFRFEDLDVIALARDVAREFRQESAGSERVIEVSSDLPRCPIRGDREALGRAVWNLIDNAAKYSPPHSTVSLSVGRANGHVRLRITDEGPGIPADEQREIFQKFVRGRDARASSIRGSGLGLAMVREIVRAHHGDVLLESAPGQGSSFTLVLPSEDAS